MPKTASASVRPRTCAIPQSSRVMVTLTACFCQRSTSGLCEVAARDVHAADRSNRPRTSFFMKLDFDMGSEVPGSPFKVRAPEPGTWNAEPRNRELSFPTFHGFEDRGRA